MRHLLVLFCCSMLSVTAAHAEAIEGELFTDKTACEVALSKAEVKVKKQFAEKASRTNRELEETGKEYSFEISRSACIERKRSALGARLQRAGNAVLGALSLPAALATDFVTALVVVIIIGSDERHIPVDSTLSFETRKISLGFLQNKKIHSRYGEAEMNKPYVVERGFFPVIEVEERIE